MAKIFMDSLGWIGAMFFIVSYFFLVMEVWKSSSSIYHIFNILGAILLTLNTLYDASLPSVFINVIWGGIAFYGLWKDKLQTKKQSCLPEDLPLYDHSDEN